LSVPAHLRKHVVIAELVPGSARASRAGDGAPAIADFSETHFGGGAEMSTRGRVRSPNKDNAALLGAQGFYWINEGGAIGGEETGDQCCRPKNR